RRGGRGGAAASTPGRAAGGGALFCLVSAGCRGRGSKLGRGGGRVGGGRGRCAGLRIGRRRRPGSRLSSPPPGGAGAWRRLTGGGGAFARPGLSSLPRPPALRGLLRRLRDPGRLPSTPPAPRTP